MTDKTNTEEVNIDLQRERAAAEIDAEELAEWWAGGRDALRKRRALEELFFNDPTFEDPIHITYMSHKELYEYSVAKATRFISKLRQWHELEQQNAAARKSNIEMMYEFRMLLTTALGSALFPQSFSLRLHFSMFLPTLLKQSTAEQQSLWLDKAWRLEGIIGTYAQTELGHGTFVRGLETRADYDEQTEEFILNTPSLTAYKWWPGGLGHTANMAIVLAQLYIKGKHYGLQTFLVRIRDEQTHEPMPGVEVGEIGTKLCANGINNGFLGFKNVRIPRQQMLSQNAQVQPNGKFVRGSEPLLTYGTMVFVRVMIVRDVCFGLLQAATIATRYSAVRRQSPIDPKQPEPQILDHLTQQAKVFSEIAKGVLFRFAADRVWDVYKVVNLELEAGRKRNLAELHALSCCLKAVCTQEACTGILNLRKACGGNGYLSSSNFDQIYGLATAAETYEGENTVLLLQTARFLVKNYLNGLKRHVLPGSVTYLRDQSRINWPKTGVASVSNLVRALEITATETIRLAFEQQRTKQKQLNNKQMADNLVGLKFTEAATLHGRAYLARLALNKMQEVPKQLKPQLAAVLLQLLEIAVLQIFFSSLSHVLRFNALHHKQLEKLEERFEQLLLAFRRNAVAFVDGFDFHDRVLGSTLGCYDGRVYERLMAEAKKSPLNQESVNCTFHSHLKPLMQGKL